MMKVVPAQLGVRGRPSRNLTDACPYAPLNARVALQQSPILSMALVAWSIRKGLSSSFSGLTAQIGLLAAVQYSLSRWGRPG
jgi:hypothetical protein